MLVKLEQKFGSSNRFNNSIKCLNESHTRNKEVLSHGILEEAKSLAACTFEENTK